MKTINNQSSIHFYKDFQELIDTDIIALCAASIEALDDAYAVYSNYRVGASILLEDLTIIKGSNQENAVYPLGLCAERVALFSSTSQYPGRLITGLAVTTAKVLGVEELPPFPCGSCRQVILEFEQRQDQSIPLYIVGSNRSVCVVSSVKDLLPFAFDKEKL